MKKITITAFLAVLALMPYRADLLAAPKGAAAQTRNAPCVRAALSWLALTDGGQYSQSWTEAAGYFKNSVAQEKWEPMVESVRAPLGAVKSRKLKSSASAKTLPGAPDGEYVVVQFKTAFENKASAMETVTVMKEPDGAWRTVGYFIK